MRPVAGRLAARGPEFCRERGPEFFEADRCPWPGSFLERGPELELGRLNEPRCVICGGGGLLRGPELEVVLALNEPALAAAEDEDVAVEPPVRGPDLLVFGISTEISNILPSSPDFLMSPPVYGMAVEVMVGALSLYWSGVPDT